MPLYTPHNSTLKVEQISKFLTELDSQTPLQSFISPLDIALPKFPFATSSMFSLI